MPYTAVNTGLPFFATSAVPEKRLSGGSLVKVGAKGLERVRFRHASDEKICGARHGAQFDAFDGVGLGRQRRPLRFAQTGRNPAPAELPNISRSTTLIGFLEVEAAGLFAKAHYAVNARGASGIVLLEEMPAT
jgi:hypothetical protein